MSLPAGHGNALNFDLAVGQASTATMADLVGQMKAILGAIAGSASDGQAIWKGVASRAFSSTHNEWQDIATRLNAALNEMENNLSVSFKGYGNSDVEVAGVFHQSAAGGGELLRF